MNVISEAILKILDGSSKEKKVHWSSIVEGTKSLCTFDELIVAMNNVLMPFGEVSGADHNYWIGKP